MPHHGDQCYEVETVTDVVIDDLGDLQPDEHVYLRRDVSTYEAAQRLARDMLPRSYYGEVGITLFEYVPFDPTDPTHVGYWEAIADTEYIYPT
jgi:hypothetical protein